MTSTPSKVARHEVALIRNDSYTEISCYSILRWAAHLACGLAPLVNTKKHLYPKRARAPVRLLLSWLRFHGLPLLEGFAEAGLLPLSNRAGSGYPLPCWGSSPSSSLPRVLSPCWEPERLLGRLGKEICLSRRRMNPTASRLCRNCKFDTEASTRRITPRGSYVRQELIVVADHCHELASCC